MGDPHMTELANACFDGVETHGCYAAASALFMPFATDIWVQTANGEVPLSRKIKSSLFANKHFLRFALEDHDVFSEKFKRLGAGAIGIYVGTLAQFYATIQNYEHIPNVKITFEEVVKERLITLGIPPADFNAEIQVLIANFRGNVERYKGVGMTKGKRSINPARAAQRIE